MKNSGTKYRRRRNWSRRRVKKPNPIGWPSITTRVPTRSLPSDWPLKNTIGTLVARNHATKKPANTAASGSSLPNAAPTAMPPTSAMLKSNRKAATR